MYHHHFVPKDRASCCCEQSDRCCSSICFMGVTIPGSSPHRPQNSLLYGNPSLLPRNGRKAQPQLHETLLLQNWVFMFLSCQDHIRSIFIRQKQSSAAPSSGAPTSLSIGTLSHSVQISCLHRICTRKKLLTHKSVSNSSQQEI